MARIRGVYLVLLVLSYLFFLFYFFEPWIGGDGLGYYAYIRSMVMDGDLNFYNEYRYYNPFGWEQSGVFLNPDLRTATGMVPNPWSIGPSILWAPFFLIGHLLALLLNWSGHFVPLSGYSDPYTWMVCLGTTIYGLIGVVLMYRFCSDYYPESISLMSVVTIWLSSPLLFYMYSQPASSHALSMFGVGLFIYIWYKTRGKRYRKMWCILGLAGGLMALVRWQDAIFLAVPLLEFLSVLTSRYRTRNFLNVKKEFIDVTLFFCSFVLAFSPQMVAWSILYGSPLTIPQGPEFFQWLSPKIPEVLFSPFRGLFSWTPALFFASLGLHFFAEKDGKAATYFFIAFLLQIYLNGAVVEWWGGHSFGMRKFVDCTPIFVVGYAAFLNKLRSYSNDRTALITVISFFFILWNVFLTLQFIHDPSYFDRLFSFAGMVEQQFTLAPGLVLKHFSLSLTSPHHIASKIREMNLSQMALTILIIALGVAVIDALLRAKSKFSFESFLKRV